MNDIWMAIVRVCADGLLVAITALAGMYLLRRTVVKPWYWTYARVVLAGITSYVVAQIVAKVWQPQELRPFELLGVEPGAAYLDNPGFPSDHMLFAMFLVLAVWYATRDKRMVIVLAVMTLLMGVARVLALVHTPLDIVGGIVFAFVGVVWYGRNAKKVVQYKKRNK